MHGSSMKDVLHASADRTPGKHARESNRFLGHEARLAAHIHRIRNHPCERIDGKKCPDCTRGRL
jgi:hypothetical protein